MKIKQIPSESSVDPKSLMTKVLKLEKLDASESFSSILEGVTLDYNDILISLRILKTSQNMIDAIAKEESLRQADQDFKRLDDELHEILENYEDAHRFDLERLIKTYRKIILALGKITAQVIGTQDLADHLCDLEDSLSYLEKIGANYGALEKSAITLQNVIHTTLFYEIEEEQVIPYLESTIDIEELFNDFDEDTIVSNIVDHIFVDKKVAHLLAFWANFYIDSTNEVILDYGDATEITDTARKALSDFEVQMLLSGV